MRSFEDFMVGEIMMLGTVEVTAEDIRSFAERFDPQPMHLADDTEQNSVEQNSVVSGMFASGLHTVCLHMRLFADGVLRDSTSMGSPGVEEARYLAPVRAGDSLTLRVEVVGARPSRSRPEMGLVVLRSQMINARSVPALEMTATLMLGRRSAAGVDEAT
jgi:acyl dehydratase